MNRALANRYARAAAALPIPSLARTLNAAVDGYWIDCERYFFVEDRIGADGRPFALPRLADLGTGSITTPIERDALSAIIEAEGGALAGDLSFDMPEARLLAVHAGGRWLLIDLAARTVAGVEDGAAAESFSPCGRWACFVRGHDLWLRDRGNGAVRPLTNDGAEHWCYGREPENGLAPLTYRHRPWPLVRWSDDGAWLLTHRIDERGLPGIAFTAHSPPSGGPPVTQHAKFSKPGDPLPLYRIVAIEIATGRAVAGEPWPLQTFSPIATGAAWFYDPARAHYLRQDRFRHMAELVELDLADGRERVIVREEADTGYVDTHALLARPPNIQPLPGTDELIWWSERDGFGHLYLLGLSDGRVRGQITRGNWQVRDIVHVDPGRRRVMFTAGGIDPERDPGLRAMCAANFDGGGFEVLLRDRGDVAVAALRPGALLFGRPFRAASASSGASPDGRYIAARLTGLGEGARTVIFDVGNGSARTLVTASFAARRDAPVPELVQVTGADGITPLWGALFHPTDFSTDQRYPLVDFIYPGPQFAWLPRAYGTRVAAQAQAWAELGMIVLVLDSRGMPFRSRALHQAGYGALFEPQLADHAAVINQLAAARACIDRERIGIAGYSGGGAAAVRALAHYPEVFRAGVSLCGNHDSRLYRSIWLDYYVGPTGPAQAEAQANTPLAASIGGDLLLMHGDADENVPLAQTIALADALIAAGRPFEFLVFPNEGHDLLFTSAYAQQRIWDFWIRYLIGACPPEYTLRYAAADRVRYARAIARELGA